MKNFTGLTLCSSLLLTSLNVNANMTRTLFRCQIEDQTVHQDNNSSVRYRDLDLSFLKNSNNEVEVMNVVLRGTRTQNLTVDANAPVGDPNLGMSLEISESDFRWDPPQEEEESPKPEEQAEKPKAKSGGFWSLFGGGSSEEKKPTERAAIKKAVPPQVITFSGGPAAPPTPYSVGSTTTSKILLDGTVVPVEQPKPYIPKWETKTIVSETEETLTFDYLYELTKRQIDYNDTVEMNTLIQNRNYEKQYYYDQAMLQYEASLEEAASAGVTNPDLVKPVVPMMEALLPLPQSPLNASYTYREFATERGQPKTFLNVVLNSATIANLECRQTDNLVDNKSKIEADVKGMYGGGSRSADPRAKALATVVPTINRMHREPWCLKKTVQGTINLAQFSKGQFKVKCDFVSSRPSDN